MSDLKKLFSLSSSGVIPNVTFALPPNAHIVAHPGAVIEKSPDITMGVSLRSPTQSGLAAWSKRAFAGMPVTVIFTNMSAIEEKSLMLHPPSGGCVAWIDTGKVGSIIAKKGTFLAGTHDIEIDIVKVAPLLRGRQDTFMEVLTIPGIAQGKDGHIFLQSKGVILERELKPGEEVHLHYDSLLAATRAIEVGVSKIDGMAARWMGSEGRYFTSLKGPGTYWLQTSSSAASSPGGGGVSLDLGALAM